MRFFKRGAVDEPVGPVPDEWAVSEGQYDGNRLIARFRTGARGLVGSSRHSIQIGVAVPLLAPDSEGMPSSEELATLEGFEDALVARAGDHAVHVGVITTRGMREFVLYTGSGDWLAAFDRDITALLPTHTVQVMAKTDPKWTVYRQFVPA